MGHYESLISYVMMGTNCWLYNFDMFEKQRVASCAGQNGLNEPHKSSMIADTDFSHLPLSILISCILSYSSVI